MSRNAISANCERYILKISRDPPRRPKKIFLAAAWLKNFFQDRLPPSPPNKKSQIEPCLSTSKDVQHRRVTLNQFQNDFVSQYPLKNLAKKDQWFYASENVFCFQIVFHQ